MNEAQPNNTGSNSTSPKSTTDLEPPPSSKSFADTITSLVMGDSKPAASTNTNGSSNSSEQKQQQPQQTRKKDANHDEPDLLLERFGSPGYYEDVFRNIQHCNYEEIFRILETTKGNKSDDRYEAARQEFIRIYGKHKGRWFRTSDSTDHNVEVTRVHLDGQEDYLALMRIKPNGIRGERYVPPYMNMYFHLLMGKVLLTYKRRPRTLTRGCHFQAVPKSTFSLKCISQDQEAIFVFKIDVDKTRQAADQQTE